MAVVKRPSAISSRNEENRAKAFEVEYTDRVFPGTDIKIRKGIIQTLKENREKEIEKEWKEHNMNKENSQEETLTTENTTQETKETSTDTTEEINKNYDLQMFQPSSSKSMSREHMIAGAISVINSSSGKRVTLSKDLMSKLNNPTKVVMSFTEDKIAIGERVPNNDNYLNIIVRGAKGNIYSAGLVSEITEMYELDFRNKTSITFSEVDYVQNDGYMIAIINVKSLIKGGRLDGQV